MNTKMPAEAGVTDAPGATIGAPYLRCIGCDADVSAPTEDFACPACGDRIEIAYRRTGAPDPGVLKTLWQARKLSQAPIDLSGVWRFREALPILPVGATPVTLREGNTPIYPLARCAKAAGVDALFAKHQGMNPTGSFKDTGMTTALSMARVGGFRWVGCASTGNTSASMAAYAAHAGMRALVLIPEGKIAWGKLSQSMDYAAFTCQVKADFDGCVRVLGDVIRRFPLYLLNSVNPYRLEGQKTTAYEMMEQLGWEPPDHVIVPGGNLGNSSALGKGFREMLAMGLISRLPRLSIIQARGANPLVHEGIRGRAHRTGARRNPRHRHSHRQPGFVEEGRRRAARDRRGMRGRIGRGDRRGQSRDRRRWRGLRAGLGGYARRPEEPGAQRVREARRIGGAGAHRPLPQGPRVHHGLPPRRGRRRSIAAQTAGAAGGRAGLRDRPAEPDGDVIDGEDSAALCHHPAGNLG
jgi:threonine synthase